MAKIISSLKMWVKKNPKEAILIVLLILISAFFRFYRLEEYMTFLGDEGRDSIVIKKILVNHDFPLLGAVTSIGNIYNGPLYYYMMAVAMGIFWLNPVAAAGMVALIGTATVGIIYYLSREWFGKLSAAVAAILYSISPINIVYSRSSWNPNPAPFFGLLCILGIYLYRKSKKSRWIILTGGALAFAIQMHPLALILIPIIGILWLIELISLIKAKKSKANFLISSLVAVTLFLFLMSPLLIYDLKYDFQNYKNFKAYFVNRESTVNLNVFNSFVRVIPIYVDGLVGRYFSLHADFLKIILSIVILIPPLLAVVNLIKRRKVEWPNLALGVWLMVGILGLSLNKQHIYDHYYTFLNPAPYILVGSFLVIITKIKDKLGRKIGLAFFSLFFIYIIFLNFQKSPLLIEPFNQHRRTQEIARYVIMEAQDKPYNFALIAERNYDAAYQFYLDMYNHKPKELPFEKTDQLFVVCEDAVCNPVGHPKAEISHFGWSMIEKEYEPKYGVKLYKLVHNPAEFEKSK